MKANATQRIYQILSSLRVYALEQDSLIDAELSAYNAGFLWIEEKLHQLEQRAFVQTATEEDLKRHEQLVGLFENSHLRPERRREMVIHRLSLAPHAFTTEEISRSLNAVGIEAQVREFPLQERMTLAVTDFLDPWLDMDRVTQRLDSMLPAHVHWEFDYGVLTWNLLESSGVWWNQWDQKDFTWNNFDQEGEHIFT